MLKLKVCGVRDLENYREVASLKPDLIGINFYEKSPRYAGGVKGFTKQHDVALTGIFVDKPVEEVLKISAVYDLDLVQLHGNESPQVCEQLKKKGKRIIKVFPVGIDIDFDNLKPYLSSCEYFLFDTAGNKPGGTGRTFNWEILDHYPFDKPFFLAGGISPDNVEELLKLNIPQLYALDVNSGYEDSPGVKNIEKLIVLKELMKRYDRN